MCVRMASSFLRRLYLLSVATRYPFAAGWIVSKHSAKARVRLESTTFHTRNMNFNRSAALLTRLQVADRFFSILLFHFQKHGRRQEVSSPLVDSIYEVSSD